jgi:hypothetical protein
LAIWVWSAWPKAGAGGAQHNQNSGTHRNTMSWYGTFHCFSRSMNLYETPEFRYYY